MGATIHEGERVSDVVVPREGHVVVTGFTLVNVPDGVSDLREFTSAELVDPVVVEQVTSDATSAASPAAACAVMGAPADLVAASVDVSVEDLTATLWPDDDYGVICGWAATASVGDVRDPDGDGQFDAVFVTVGDVDQSVAGSILDPAVDEVVKLPTGEDVVWLPPVPGEGLDSSVLMLADADATAWVMVEAQSMSNDYDEVGAAVMASVLEAVG